MYEETDTSRIYRLSRELSEAKKNFTIIVDALIEIAKRHHSQQACAEIADEALAKVKEIPMREVDNMTDDRSSELIASYDSPSAKRIEQLERELAEAKAEADKWEKLHDQDTEHLASLQKRDNYGPTETLSETAMRLSRELAEAQKQRDMLAEAIRSFNTYFERVVWGYDGDCGTYRLVDRLLEALAAVKGGEA